MVRGGVIIVITLLRYCPRRCYFFFIMLLRYYGSIIIFFVIMLLCYGPRRCYFFFITLLHYYCTGQDITLFVITSLCCCWQCYYFLRVIRLLRYYEVIRKKEGNTHPIMRTICKSFEIFFVYLFNYLTHADDGCQIWRSGKSPSASIVHFPYRA